MDDWTVVDDPLFYKGLFERWQLECQHLQGKIDHHKARLERIRQAFRDVEHLEGDAEYRSRKLLTEIHRIVFN